MLTLTHHSLSRLLSLLLLLSAVRLAWTLLKREPWLASMLPKIALPNWKERLLALKGASRDAMRQRMPEISRHLRPLFLVGVGFAIGFQCSEWAHSYQDEVSQSQRYTFRDVTILSRHDAQNFTVDIPRKGVYEWATCSAVDWREGERMIFVHYAQYPGCKDASAGGEYKFYTYPNGNRIIYQTGEITDNVRR